MILVDKRQDPHTFTEFADTIEGRAAVGHFGDILPDANPGILIDLTGAESFPRLRRHRIKERHSRIEIRVWALYTRVNITLK